MRKSEIVTTLLTISSIITMMLVLSSCIQDTVQLSATTEPIDTSLAQNQQEKPTTQPIFPKTVTVEIKEYKFKPEEIIVNRGDTIEWINQDGARHSILLDGEIQSPDLKQLQRWNTTIMQPGTHHYRCGIHPSMTGVIVVN